MIVVKMPLYSDDFYNYTISLQNQKYNISFLWNERDSAWRMSIKHEDLTPIVVGYKLVSSYPMMADYALEDDGLTGYFLLLPKSVEVGLLGLNSGNMFQYYDLFYIFEEE